MPRQEYFMTMKEKAVLESTLSDVFDSLNPAHRFALLDYAIYLQMIERIHNGALVRDKGYYREERN